MRNGMQPLHDIMLKFVVR